ncbi:hypothetical protein L1887_09102 [Cichorium endivia]|nr:hypothetical protein L1887_09102 [Cichorium endivia]
MSIIPSFFTGRRSNVFDPFSLDIWDPFQGISSVLSNFPDSSRETAAIANARIDWKETPEAHIFKADLPGLKKEEVKVEVEEGRVLQLSGERSRENEEKNEKWHRVERSSGKFLRRFRLPENAKMEEVKATMENGVLTVTVPKAEEKKPAVKSIDINPSPNRPSSYDPHINISMKEDTHILQRIVSLRSTRGKSTSTTTTTNRTATATALDQSALRWRWKVFEDEKPNKDETVTIA